MKTRSISVLLCAALLGVLVSCKKKSSDPEPEPETETPVNQLCDGNGGASYMPLDSTDSWTYTYKIGGITQSTHPSPKVMGHQTYGGVKYAYIHDSPAFGDSYYRENVTTHDIYEYDTNSSNEYLAIPGSPTLNQTWNNAYATRKVTNLSASKSTASCTYSGLLEITETTTGSSPTTTKYYYKKGLGLVYSIGSGSFASEWTLTGVSLK